MKTKNNSMKIMKTESTANEQERKEAKYKPVTPVILDNVSEDVTFIRSADVCKLLNVSNSTLRNQRRLFPSTSWAERSFTTKKKS